MGRGKLVPFISNTVRDSFRCNWLLADQNSSVSKKKFDLGSLILDGEIGGHCSP